MTWTAVRTDCVPTPAHGGARLATRPGSTSGTSAPKQRINGAVAPMSASVFVPAYVADKESHPPRELVG